MDDEEIALREKYQLIYSEYCKWEKEEFRKIRDPYNRDVLPLVKAYKEQYKDFRERVKARYKEVLEPIYAEIDEKFND
jgi:hypothetical protein